jgi:excisionase family DNA binding protein
MIDDDCRRGSRRPSGNSTDRGGAGSDPGSQLLTADDLARLLGVTRAWVYAQSRAGGIPTVRLGCYRRYRREAIAAWLEQLEGGVRVMRGDGAKARDRIS